MSVVTGRGNAAALQEKEPVPWIRFGVVSFHYDDGKVIDRGALYGAPELALHLWSVGPTKKQALSYG